MLHRRLVRDHDRRPASAESWVYWAMTGNMTRRLTGTAAATTTTWRHPPAATAPPDPAPAAVAA